MSHLTFDQQDRSQSGFHWSRARLGHWRPFSLPPHLGRLAQGSFGDPAMTTPPRFRAPAQLQPLALPSPSWGSLTAGTGTPVTILPFCPAGPGAAFCRKPGQRRTPARRKPVGPRPAHIPILHSLSRIPESLPCSGSSALTCIQQPVQHCCGGRHSGRVDRDAAETLPARQSASPVERAGLQRRMQAGRTAALACDVCLAGTWA